MESFVEAAQSLDREDGVCHYRGSERAPAADAIDGAARQAGPVIEAYYQRRGGALDAIREL